MTTVAYDKYYMAADSAYTRDGVTSTTIPFSKLQKIDDVVFGMAGMLSIMINFTKEMINSQNFDIKNFLMAQDGEFGAILYKNGICLKIDKGNSIIIEDITNIPTVIGSGSYFAQDIIEKCPDAVVVVLDAIEKDNYSKGKVHYYGLNCGINNLNDGKTEMENFQKFLDKESLGNYVAHKEFFHLGTPIELPLEVGFEMINKMINEKQINNYCYRCQL